MNVNCNKILEAEQFEMVENKKNSSVASNSHLLDIQWSGRPAHFIDFYFVILHRQKCLSCSSSWPPKTLRSSACRPSCWPKAAQPTTTRTEVHTADITSTSASANETCEPAMCMSVNSTLITVTSNQHVPLSSAVYLTCSWLSAALCCRGGVYQASD